MILRIFFTLYFFHIIYGILFLMTELLYMSEIIYILSRLIFYYY